MPCVNRAERAINNSNPLVGCIMALQKKIKFLGCSIVGCHCPEHESSVFSLNNDLASLREELASLQAKYKSVTSHNTRLRTFIRKSDTQYRARIKTLLLDNSSRLVVGVCQDKAYRAEIISLRTQVDQLQEILVEQNIPLPSSPPPSPWLLNTESYPPTWTVNRAWTLLHPGEFPPDAPSDYNF